ncbi:MAG: DUF3343 domain-containing protein [Spirochaetaceae bacterium]|jgi:hypothetical protein|nr:DUF3343 domain-containing protein [Spirochaetaceae bacterium]
MPSSTGGEGKLEEAIICFESAAQAIMAEQALLEHKFYVRVMPTPSAIRAGCGFCLRFLPEELDKAALFLAQNGLAVKEAYLSKADCVNSYEKIKL